MTSFIKSFFKDDSGATAIEYGLIAALVSVAAVGALGALGGDLSTMFGAVSTELQGAVAGSGGGGGSTP